MDAQEDMSMDEDFPTNSQEELSNSKNLVMVFAV